MTGVSGSGKSSLAFDTLYAEGQRRYLESLSTYARMIISDISEATKVREIRGLSPTIAIHQKTVSNNPRSTVGTITEIYDFYRLLYTSIGVPHCPNHPDTPLRKQTLQNIVDHVSIFGEGCRFHILIPLTFSDGIPSFSEIRARVTDLGFVRFQIGKQVFSIAEENETKIGKKDVIYVIVDRLIRKNDDEFITRLRDSLRVGLEK